MMKIGKVVLIASVAALISVQSGCISVVDEETGEKMTKFAPVEAVKKAAAAVGEIPDEAKADIFECLAWLLGFAGSGGAATLTCQKVAAYYRNRKKTQIACDKENGDSVSTDDVV